MATIKDVAKYTGLSIATISKYLNGGNVLEENRTAIENAIQLLDYKVNQMARSLKTNRTNTIGILIPLLSSAFFSRIVTAIDEALYSRGYNCFVCGYDFNVETEKQKLSFMLESNVDGIILVPEGLTPADIEEFKPLASHNVPLVLIDRFIKGFQCDTVLTDNMNACYFAVEQLIIARHKRIGIIVGPENVSTSVERTMGYRRVHEDYSLPIDEMLIKEGDYTIESGYRMFLELLDMPQPPTAVFVTNYDMMLGAVTAAHERGINVPTDIDFIGFDNIELSRIINPPFSIVMQPMEKMGQTAAELMLERIGGSYDSYPLLVRHKAELLRP